MSGRPQESQELQEELPRVPMLQRLEAIPPVFFGRAGARLPTRRRAYYWRAAARRL